MKKSLIVAIGVMCLFSGCSEVNDEKVKNTTEIHADTFSEIQAPEKLELSTSNENETSYGKEIIDELNKEYAEEVATESVIERAENNTEVSSEVIEEIAEQAESIANIEDYIETNEFTAEYSDVNSDTLEVSEALNDSLSEAMTLDNWAGVFAINTLKRACDEYGIDINKVEYTGNGFSGNDEYSIWNFETDTLKITLAIGENLVNSKAQITEKGEQ